MTMPMTMPSTPPTSASTKTLADHVAELERISARMDNATLPALQERLAERQEVLTHIQTADTSTLTEAQKRDLHQRIVKVLRHDLKFIVVLSALKDETAKTLNTLGSARGKMKGYHSGPLRTGVEVRRSA